MSILPRPGVEPLGMRLKQEPNLENQKGLQTTYCEMTAPNLVSNCLQANESGDARAEKNKFQLECKYLLERGSLSSTETERGTKYLSPFLFSFRKPEQMRASIAADRQLMHG